MSHQEPGNRDPQYGETVDPRNPPNSVLRPAVRRTALSTYLGGIIVLFIIVGAALAYWTSRDHAGDTAIEQPDRAAVGTAGAREREDPGRGGFEPAPDHDTTKSEIEFRGGGDRTLGTTPGLTTDTPLNELGSLFEAPPNAVAGRRIDLRDVDVERATEGNTFWVRDGDARAAVVAPAGTPAVRQGQRVAVSGTVEPDGAGSARIRATRIDVR